MGRSRGLSTVATAYDGGSLGYRNLVINGAMQIAQRGTSVTSITSGTGVRTVDRFNFRLSNIGTYTVSQDTDAPYGFSNSFKVDCTTADASSTAGDFLVISQGMEGLMCQQLAKGTSSAKSVTVSFWVKCNKTGDLQVNLVDYDNSRVIGNTVTINSSATWEKKSLTFAGDTTGTIDNDSSESLRLEFWLDSGTDYSSGSVPTSWTTLSNVDRNAGGTLALSDSTSNYINITGVQLEVGDAATDFEHRPFTTEESLCFRYYVLCASSYYSAMYGSGAMVQIDLPVNMRSTPTISYTSETGSGSILTYPRQRRIHFYDNSDASFNMTAPTADAEF